MRFTKIPLIATLMAVALSLLIVLPTLAQVSGDRTDGRQSAGDWIDVRVADNLDDLDNSPGDATPAPTNIGSGGHAWATTAGTTNGAFDARDTYFNGDLYISNQESGFNTILITARVAGQANLATTGPTGNLDDSGTADDPATPAVENDESMGACAATSGDPLTGGVAIATIKNARNNDTATAYLFNTGESETVGTDTVTIYQGIAVVWDQEDAIESHDGPCNVSTQDTTTPGQKDPVQYDAANDTFGETTNVDANGVSEIVAPVDGWDPNSAAVIPARDGDTITVTVKGVGGSVTLIVDGDPPEIEDASPAHGGRQNKGTVNLGFTVSDDGSGIRYDGEAGGSTDSDLQPFNGDNDGRFDEPITNAGPDDGDATTIDAGDGRTMDIMVFFAKDTDSGTLPYLDPDNANAPTNEATRDVAGVETANPANPLYTSYRVNFDHPADDVSQYGSNDWSQRVKGMSYDLDMRLITEGFDTYYWQVTAKDRVGNMAVTDSDEDTSGEHEPFSFIVDDDKPDVDTARTGVRYDAGEGEKPDRSWIALNFVNEDNGGADRIDASTVEPSDFTVDGHTVVEAVVPDDKKVCKDPDPDKKNITRLDAPESDALGCDFEPRARIYLKLAEPLDSDETPDIQLLGGVLKDIAGNNNVTRSVEDTQDKIAPGISITVTSSTDTSSGRPATDGKGTFTVRVTSDEDTDRFPLLYFATIAGTATDGVADDLTIDGIGNFDLTEKETNVWEAKVKETSLPGNGTDDDRILAVIVTARDTEGNPGNSAGWKGSGTPAATQSLDFKKLDAGGFLVEIDSSFPSVTDAIKVLPPRGSNDDETESTNPYIQIKFSEGGEYGIDGATKVDIGDGDTANTDSHAEIEITSITLDGAERKDELVRVKAGEYVLAVTGLEVGEYEIVYSAQDDVGNDVEDEEFTFEVLERQPYEVTLQPGWNLISVPGDPFNPAVGEVIGADLRANTVLGYQAGEWVTSVKNDDGRWQGTLTDIRAGYGYWVRTTAVETIETVIPPSLPTSVLPTVPVISGWNLLGVVDAEQRPSSGTNAGTEDADEYFTSLPNWRVAYSFQTQQNRWAKLLPSQADANVENGRGYWVWSSRPGTLVP